MRVLLQYINKSFNCGLVGGRETCGPPRRKAKVAQVATTQHQRSSHGRLGVNQLIQISQALSRRREGSHKGKKLVPNFLPWTSSPIEILLSLSKQPESPTT